MIVDLRDASYHCYKRCIEAVFWLQQDHHKRRLNGTIFSYNNTTNLLTVQSKCYSHLAKVVDNVYRPLIPTLYKELVGKHDCG